MCLLIPSTIRGQRRLTCEEFNAAIQFLEPEKTIMCVGLGFFLIDMRITGVASVVNTFTALFKVV